VPTHRTCLIATLSCAALLILGSASAAEDKSAGAYAELAWRMIGPFRGGRTRAVAGVPAQEHVFYIGAVNGGVWKTQDAGRTWQPIFDSEPTQSIGAIAVAPSDPNVLYVGSGEGLLRPDLSVGNGIYRSSDGGVSWSHRGLTDAQQIPELAVDPGDPNRVFAAVLGHPYGPSSERGIYRSLDGGASWERVLYRDENTGGSAVAIDPAEPQTVYAALWQSRLGPWEDKNEFQGTGGGLFKSSDGWQHLEAARGGTAQGSGADQHRHCAERAPAAVCDRRYHQRRGSTPPPRGWGSSAPTTAARTGRGSRRTRGRRCASAAAICRWCASTPPTPMSSTPPAW